MGKRTKPAGFYAAMTARFHEGSHPGSVRRMCLGSRRRSRGNCRGRGLSTVRRSCALRGGGGWWWGGGCGACICQFAVFGEDSRTREDSTGGRPLETIQRTEQEATKHSEAKDHAEITIIALHARIAGVWCGRSASVSHALGARHFVGWLYVDSSERLEDSSQHRSGRSLEATLTSCIKFGQRRRFGRKRMPILVLQARLSDTRGEGMVPGHALLWAMVVAHRSANRIGRVGELLYLTSAESYGS